MAPRSMTLNDLELLCVRIITEFFVPDFADLGGNNG